MRVLIADDDKRVCNLLTEFVSLCGHEVVAAVTKGGLEVIRSFSENQPDLVLLDVFMPRCNGLTVCHALLSRNPGARVVLMSGLSEGNHPFITGCKAAGFLNKPLRLEEVRQVLELPEPYRDPVSLEEGEGEVTSELSMTTHSEPSQR